MVCLVEGHIQQFVRSGFTISPLAQWDQQWPAGALIFPTFEANADYRLHRLGPIEALNGLIHSGCLFGEKVGELLEWLEKIPAFSLHYRDLKQSVHGVEAVTKGWDSQKLSDLKS